MKTHPALVALLALFPLLPSCASVPETETLPALQVVRLDSVRITPEAIEFVGKIVVGNGMHSVVQMQHVDYCADLYDGELFHETFADLVPMPAHGTETVTLPFRVAWKDIGAVAEDLLNEQGVRVTLRGTVVPVGYAPMPFEATKVLPLPRLPRVAITGVRGNPFDGDFSVMLAVENTNDFPIDFGSIETHVALNGKRYALLGTDSFGNLPAHGSGGVTLTLHNTHEKRLGMVINVLKNKGADFTIGGTLSCRTPHGLIWLPLELGGAAAAPGR
ncbi:MAG: hypothetical protein U1E73_13865 [Planctomycetota bacterium]